jgi:pimeloyl-ACP methyl ester carboxylesterase
MIMRRIILLGVAVVFAVACSSSKDDGWVSVAQKAERDAGRPSLDYSDPQLWACTHGSKSDICDEDYSLARVEADGSAVAEPYKQADDNGLDCFYIYPTMDMDVTAGNHDNPKEHVLQDQIIRTQAGRFGEACRVYAPYYRQGTIGSYDVTPEKATPVFMKAYADIAAAFEYYLKNWNNGRLVVIMGHSQGGQMSSYLLHTFFDGARKVSTVPGSEMSNEIRARLVVALPLGSNIFIERGATNGGIFSDIPLCTSLEQTGCVIHYRSYPEGYDFTETMLGSVKLNNSFADRGYLNRRMSADTDTFACTNPSVTALPAGDSATDIFGKPLAGDVRVLTGSYLIGISASEGLESVTGLPYQDVPGRYTATCRFEPGFGDYLAIGLHDVPGKTDVRGDPGNVKTSTGGLGLHMQDYNIPFADLIAQVKAKLAAKKKGG